MKGIFKKTIFAVAAVVMIVLAWNADAVTAKAEAITLIKDTTSWDGKTLPAYPKGQPEITVFKGIIPPGCRSKLHKHPVIGSYYILKGELTVITSDNKEIQAKAGHAYNEVVGDWHYGINKGKETVELIFFYAGSKGVANSEEWSENNVSNN